MHRGRGTLFEPLPTTGVPLASREDWPQVLEAAADTGTSTVWVAFHGLGEEHDRQVNRRGAFAETCLAIQRIHAMGLRVGCNVFVTTANLPQLDQLAATLAGPSIDAEMCWETAQFLPSPRSRRNERLRPSLPELLPVAGQILELTAPIHCEMWANLAAHTEAAYVGRAVAGEWPAAPKRPDGELALVCRPNLDVWTGLAGRYRPRLPHATATPPAWASISAASRPTPCGWIAQPAPAVVGVNGPYADHDQLAVAGDLLELGPQAVLSPMAQHLL